MHAKNSASPRTVNRRVDIEPWKGLNTGFHMIRLGLCCIFREQPIRFRRTTAKHLARFDREEQVQRLAGLCRHNAGALMDALIFCSDNGIGAFRVNSQILPLATHPEAGYALEELPGGPRIRETFENCGCFAREQEIRLSFHPDQFVLLSSPRTSVTRSSLAELEYQAGVARWIGADVINIHGGGAYGDKTAARNRLVEVINRLDREIRDRLTLENDDRVYTPANLMPVCRQTGVPLVYDVHHHRCLPDGNSVERTTAAALSTWGREPLFHISSPLNSGKTGPCRPHHDFIDPKDFPDCWRDLDLTVEVEAKAKELAIKKLMAELKKVP